MKLSTSFWCDKTEYFDRIFLINNEDKKVLLEAGFGDKSEICQFFKSAAKFITSKPVRDSVADYYGKAWYQFAVMDKSGSLAPIIWFELVISDKITISHDVAFKTTIIHKNNHRLSLGKFPFEDIRYPMYRELKMKARAYKYIANQINKHWAPAIV